MPTCQYEAWGRGEGDDITMVLNTWYTYLGSQNLEGTPAAPGDNGFRDAGQKYKGNLAIFINGGEDFEIRKSRYINGAWYSQIIVVKTGVAGYTDEIPIEAEGIEIDIRCTSSNNGRVVYCACVDRSTYI